MSDTEEIRVKVDSALKQRFQVKCIKNKVKMKPQVEQLITEWLEGETQLQLFSKFITSLMGGNRPANADIVTIAETLNIPTEDLLDFCDRVLNDSRGEENE